jgi:hypothetical protein
LQDRRTRKLSVYGVVIVATAVVVGVVFALGAAARSTRPGMRALVHVSTKPPPASRTLGCGDTATLDGTRDSGKEFLCGTPGNDTIKAGALDVVRASGGNDKIMASQGGPNDIDGGLGYDIAWGDRFDTFKLVQKRYLATARPEARLDKTPRGFDYNLPNVICGVNLQNQQPMIRVDLPTGQRIQMAAYNANPGVVDWQYVAWSEVVLKFDRPAAMWRPYFQSDWLWDRTYDLGELKRHIPNEWHSFVAGQDDQQVDPEPLMITEPGDYAVHFRYYWYPESAATSATTQLLPLPGESVEYRAIDYQGKFVGTQKLSTTGRPFYCRFP